MRFLPRRFLEEFFLYSSQFVLFYILVLFTSPAVLRPSTGIIFTLMISLLLQIALLARYGHRATARFLLSFISPMSFTLMHTLAQSGRPFDMATFFLWVTAFYLGMLQAVGLVTKTKWPKRIAEAFLSFGTIFTFVFFYFYLDLRVSVSNDYAAGLINYAQLEQQLSIANFLPGFINFTKPVQHIFIMFGALMFGLFQTSDKIKQISLKYRLDAVYTVVEPPTMPVDSAKALNTGEKRDVVILYADLWNFTPIAEKEGPVSTIGLLNRYYALWDIIARRHSGIIEQFVGDTVIIVFGLLGETDAHDSAVNCAYDFLTQFVYFQDELAEHRLPLVKHIGIGIHAGPVAAGALTAASGNPRVSVVGESVNVAARLDSLCREFKQDLLISHPVYKNLSLENQSRFQQMGEVLFRNKTQPQQVFGRK
ncbi:MAG: adenylate/guanylate cyclase domain-containing protein [Spirochaetes bacterium]|nr:adenylate/guanylate cyclase domain-containing protein [Spirochaetota bacterium]MBU0955214.1 adenylate/guanylate cyclase domain-containing protein [Spirochaetota bacterium]